MSQTKQALVSIANPGAAYLAHKEEIDIAVNEVLSSGWYVLGEQVSKFEAAFSKAIGCKHCVTVASGTDALMIALKAVGIGGNDEVITVSHSAVATVAAIELTGARAVLCDICPQSRCIDTSNISDLVSETTKAIVPVHIYGQPADLKSILELSRNYNLKVVEDCAQAHGALYQGKVVGSFGDAAAFSFYPTKNLGAIGDGGAILTNSDDTAQQVRLLRQYGWANRYVSSTTGYNSRLDEIQAAILSVKLKYLEQGNRRRREIAEYYDDALKSSSVRGPQRIFGTESVFHLYVVEVDNRESFVNYLQNKGVQTALHYPMAIHQQPAYSNRLKGGDKLPVTEEFYRRLVTIPLYPELDDQQVEIVGNALRDFDS